LYVSTALVGSMLELKSLFERKGLSFRLSEIGLSLGPYLTHA
jgi:hypothetical protein